MARILKEGDYVQAPSNGLAHARRIFPKAIYKAYNVKQEGVFTNEKNKKQKAYSFSINDANGNLITEHAILDGCAFIGGQNWIIKRKPKKQNEKRKI